MNVQKTVYSPSLPIEVEIIIFKKINTLSDIINYSKTNKKRTTIYNRYKNEILLKNTNLKTKDILNWSLVAIEYNKIDELIHEFEKLTIEKNNSLKTIIQNSINPIKMYLFKIYKSGEKTGNQRLIKAAVYFYQIYFLNLDTLCSVDIKTKIEQKFIENKYENLDLKDFLTYILVFPSLNIINEVDAYYIQHSFVQQIIRDLKLFETFLNIISNSEFLKYKHIYELKNIAKSNIQYRNLIKKFFPFNYFFFEI